MGVETVSLIIAAFVCGALGIAAMLRNFRNRLSVAFAALTLTLFLHDALCIAERLHPYLQFSSPRLHAFAILCLGPAGLFFLRALIPSYNKSLARANWLYLPFLALYLVVSWLPGYERYENLLTSFAHLTLLYPATIWLSVLLRASHASRLTRERLRLRYAFWGGIITACLYLTDALHTLGLGVPPLGTLGRTLYILFIFQILIQKELMTGDEVVARLLHFGGVAFTLSTIYALLVSWVGDRPGLFYFNTFIASFVVLTLFEPIRTLTLAATRKLLLSTTATLEREIAALSTALSAGPVEPPDLALKIKLCLERALQLNSCGLYVLDQEGLSFVRVEDSTGSIPSVSASSPLVGYMATRRGRAFVLETLETEFERAHIPEASKLKDACVQALQDLRADFVIPFVDGPRVLGFVAAESGERVLLSNDKLRLFVPIARQIAFQLKNAQAFSLLRTRDKLAAAGEMAAGLAHEIKNPLGAIKGAAELLADSPNLTKDSSELNFLNIIRTETDRLSGVLTEFLDYAKPRRQDPESTCYPLKVIEHTQQLALRDSRVTFKIESAEPELRVSMDPEILKQVLLNLFLNASQAMSDTENPTLTVRMRDIRVRKTFSLWAFLPSIADLAGMLSSRQTPDSAILEIEVEDNGPGIPREDAAKIFVPFYTTKPKGTGLGLAICHRLVEGMGGTLTLKHAKPRGALFTLHVPYKVRPDSQSVFTTLAEAKR